MIPQSFYRNSKARDSGISQWGAKDIDGISGATYSVQATLTQLRELNRWIQNSQQSPD